jgi:hypothetical protein
MSFKKAKLVAKSADYAKWEKSPSKGSFQIALDVLIANSKDDKE